MKSKTVERLLKDTPKDVEIFVDWYADLLVLIHQLLQEKNLNKKALATKLDKNPSEISKWFNGQHNFTLRSLAKLSAELGEPLITISNRKSSSEFISDGYVCKTHKFVSYTRINTNMKGKVWQQVVEEPFNEYSNVG